MTTIESNRATVLRFCDCISRRDFAGQASLVTPDATWWVTGRPNAKSPTGAHEFFDLMPIAASFLGVLDEFSFTVQGSIAEGDYVVIEAISSGRKGIARYNNNYLMQYHLRDGKIASLREFMDPNEVTAFLEQLDSQ